MDCRYRFSSKCYGFMYNSENKFCIPCGGISAYKSTPDESEGYFYFIDNDCESYVDFKQYNYIRYSEYQVQQDYDTARKTCRCVDSQLMVADTYERWASYKFFQKTNNEYWLGMDDIATEGTYVWSDGRIVATEWMNLAFSKTKPFGDGDCIYRVPNTDSADDTDCSRNLSYICEQPQYVKCGLFLITP
ncbi:lectin BRA-3-like [Biomphalaria glabrata]|uniref:Lectin BRA-3-like n=1 Tax=Biomphalaria glabrata TaxID=6526 RepID=A0A9W3BGS1_BIOGL|nr:lectin BRA-3-like [Biomphalaria glabrata]